VWAYLPGLHGGFLFDDFANLPPLGSTGPIDNWPAFWRYITSGHADPTGRPLAMLSFLLDAHNWPANPYPFKRTGLILHLFNGVLLALLLRQLGRIALDMRYWRRTGFAALLGAAFWLLHPLFVSTTFYIVQREAMLAATFTLLGLLAWLHGRRALMQGHTVSGLLWLTMGLGGCTMFALLSKANGILLPALSLTIEYTTLRVAAPDTAWAHGSSKNYRCGLLVLAWLPTAVVAGYLLNQGWNGLVHGISSTRPWTLGQRLLTEPRVLMDYLRLLWLPHPFTPGLFNDQIRASTSLWTPVGTLPALLAVAGLIIGAGMLRKRWPAVSLAVLFYFVGQSLESSTVALELYFEHRNYLPAMLMFWPLALWLCGVPLSFHAPATSYPKVPKAPPQSWTRAKCALACIILLGLGLMTHARAELWGNTHDQALMWASLNPESPRAQANAAQVEMTAGHPARAIARLRPLLAQHPNQVQLALNLFAAECQNGRVDAATLAAARTALGTTRDPGSLLTHWFVHTMAQLDKPPCPQLDYPTLGSLLDSMAANPYLAKIAGRQQDIYYLRGRLALHQDDAETALADFNLALDKQVRVAAALEQAALLGSHGFPQQGLAHLDHYETESRHAGHPGSGMPAIHAWVLERQHYWSRELQRLRATLSEDAASKVAAGK
jgi:hypothetical protein